MSQRTRTPIGVTSGVANSGTGTVPELDYFLSDDEVTVAFTPAATSHTAGDSVGGAGTFAAVGQSATLVRLVGAKLLINSATVPASSFTLWIFNSAPTSVADDAAFGVVSADKAKFLKKVSLGTPILAGVSGTATVSSIQQDGLSIPMQLTGTGLVCYLTNDATVTLVAQAHEVTLQFEPMS